MSYANVFVARQPIFDRNQNVTAYELLFRSGMENVFNHSDPDEASGRVIEGSLQTFGLDRLIGPHRAYVNVTRQVLVDGLCTVLPPDRVVIELLETIEPDAEVIAACRNLKDLGYTLALDDFVFEAGFEPLVNLADIVKVDFTVQQTAAERQALRDRLDRYHVKLLAENVETYDEFQEGVEAGYDFFQGYFFARPEMVHGRELPKFKLNYLRFMEEVNRPEIDGDRLEEVIKQEMSLSVKLLRYLNSASFGWRHEVESIAHAIRLLGERQTRQWASLVAIAGLGEDKPAELAVSSLTRAKFCESLGQEAGMDSRRMELLFLVGLLSHIDAMIDMPLSTALNALQIPTDVKSALLSNGSPLSPVLLTVEAWQRGQWSDVPGLAVTLSVSEEQIALSYEESVSWTDAALHPA